MSTEPHMAAPAATISLEAFCAEESPDQEPTGSNIPIMRIGRDASYVSFFTDQGVPVAAHYLEEDEDWTPGYVACLGDDCPACRAGMAPSRFLLMPVVDCVEGRIALLRISMQKGPGKLATEISKVLSLADRDQVIAKITRDGKFTHHVEAKPAAEHDPDVRRQVQVFAAKFSAGEIDLADAITMIPADELREYPRIARKLRMEGRA